ncbi:MAG: methyltransferase domain-containing protein [Chloroflexia bacterium]
MVSAKLLQIVRCPECGDPGALQPDGEHLRCSACGAAYAHCPGYLDLMPRSGRYAHTSRYVAEEETFAATLDYRQVGPPVLAAGVRQALLRRMLRLRPTDRVLDVGCGNGKFALWNRPAVALMVGLDPAPLFADAALECVDLVRGDARQAPFASGAFDKAFSIDVLEHLTREDLEAVLAEAYRLLRPGGRLFLYSNTREPSRLQPLIDLWRHLGAALRRRGLFGPEPDALRKADHVKAIGTFAELEALVQAHGFRVLRVRFWNSAITSFVEHVVQPFFEGKRRSGPVPASEGRAQWRARASRRGPVYFLARAVTWAMGLDIALFGRLRSGSYFLLLEKPCG